MNKIVVGGAALIFSMTVSACSEDGDAGMFPIELADSRIEAGETIYADNCASCHSPETGHQFLSRRPYAAMLGIHGIIQTGCRFSGFLIVRR